MLANTIDKNMFNEKNPGIRVKQVNPILRHSHKDSLTSRPVELTNLMM